MKLGRGKTLYYRGDLALEEWRGLRREDHGETYTRKSPTERDPQREVYGERPTERGTQERGPRREAYAQRPTQSSWSCDLEEIREFTVEVGALRGRKGEDEYLLGQRTAPPAGQRQSRAVAHSSCRKLVAQAVTSEMGRDSFPDTCC